MHMASPVRRVYAALLITAAVTSLFAIPAALAKIAGATADRTNSPPKFSDCTACHDPAAGPANGKVEITGLPACYNPGQTYNLKIKVSDPDPVMMRWGFEVAAQYNEGNFWDESSAGVIADDGGRTHTLNSADGKRKFVTHDTATADGTYAGQAGSAEWPFKWTAPTTRQTAVRFYASGLACNNDGLKPGDRTYLKTYDVSPCGATDARNSTWGNLKTLFLQ